MDRYARTRRRLLATGSLTVFAGVAGCTGSGDDRTDESERSESSDSKDSSNSNAESVADDQWDVETPNDPAFLANADVDGPSDEANYVLATTIRDHGEIDEYDRFEVTLESVALHTTDSGDVAVPLDVVVDLTAYETGPAGDIITLAWDVGIPAGTYTSLTLEASPIEIVHEADGDITDGFEEPPTAEFSADDGVEIFDNGALLTEMELEIRYDFVSGTPTFEESLGVNTNAMDSVVLDPREYEN